MGSCAAPSAKGDDKFITTDYLQQCLKKNKHGFLPNHTKDARKAFLNECPDNGEGGSNQSMISQIISKYGKVRL
ncbi:hypothetical protein ASU76_22340 [Enterobacter hormaechei subsp. hoffmannii]|nr:hypothetical protein ASU76_22340 [Enterobacter hormaechei subsp. hoffmannii]